MPAEPLGAHLPWSRVDQYLEPILELGLSPEIAFKGPELDDLQNADLDRVAATIARHNLRPTVHAPFFDLNPGALDPLVQDITMRRLGQSLQAARRLQAHLMVVHPGYDRWRYPGLRAAWAAQAGRFFPPLLQRAEQADCRLALENIYEETPDTLSRLVEDLGSAWLGHCFDAGHWYLFGTTPMDEWLTALGPRLFHLHLHDNLGEADDHLPLGAGEIDFDLLFTTVRQLGQRPSMTLEAHTPENLLLSLQNSRQYLPS